MDALSFYWIDAVECQAGVRLFGRAKTEDGSTKSCCVLVKNIRKLIYASPRKRGKKLSDEDVTEIEAELRSVAAKCGIVIASARRATRNYAFEHADVEYGSSDFVELAVESGDGRSSFPLDSSGRTYSRVIGTTFTPLETLIIGRGIMGPEWLSVEDRSECQPRATWCEIEVSVESPESVTPDREDEAPPPMNVLEIDVRCDASGDISVATVRSRTGFRIDRPDSDGGVVATAISGSGKCALCETLLEAIDSCDPDIVVGSALSERVLGVVSERSRINRARGWSRLGKIRGSARCTGIVACDAEVVAGNLVRRPLRSHSVVDVAEAILPGDPEIARCRSEVVSDASRATLELAWKIVSKLGALQLTLHTANIAGCIWSHTLAGLRSEQNDYLLMHSFWDLDFVLPDAKPRQTAGPAKPKAAYAGGHVIEPKPGLYSGTIVALLDFSSMYPSIIRGANACLTTKREGPGGGTGVLPRIVIRLMDERKKAKREMRDHPSAALDAKQAALKLVANSLYGCLGYEQSRFFDRELAAKITGIGRDTIRSAEKTVSDAGFRVIYGDTDSLMIDTKESTIEGARRMAENLIALVNASFKEMGLEMAVDGMFSAVLILSKKKYACVDAATGVITFKGMDLVRRDWCALASDASRSIAEVILKTADRGAMSGAISKVASRASAAARDPATPIERFAITKRLGKDPAKYGADVRALPHVRAARRSDRKAKAEDFIAYVICDRDEPEMPGTRLATAPIAGIKIDPGWYIEKQLYPALARVCRPVAELDGDRLISDSLGIAASSASAVHLGSSSKRKRVEAVGLDAVISSLAAGENPLYDMLVEDHLGDFPAFSVECPSCKSRTVQEFPRGGTFGFACKWCGGRLDAAAISEQFSAYSVRLSDCRRGALLRTEQLRSLVDRDWIEEQTWSRPASAELDIIGRAIKDPTDLGSLDIKF
jgi:DNA polymerase alpha subunit A